MLIYRICRSEFASGLKASGFASRWNLDGQRVLYASESRSLAALEQLANRSGLTLSSSYCVMVIDVPDMVDITLESDSLGSVLSENLLSSSPEVFRSLLPEALPPDWRQFSAYGRLQELGANWYRRSESLLLKVPSVFIPQEYNYLINTQHPTFSTHVRLFATENFNWDSRLV